MFHVNHLNSLSASTKNLVLVGKLLSLNKIKKVRYKIMTELYGKRFELVQRKNLHEKNEAIKAIETNLKYYNGRTLYDVYNKPSTTKVNIWKSWAEFFVNYILRQDVYKVEYCVASANTFIFTISAHISFLNGEHYYVYITPTYNKLYYYHD